MVSTSSGGGGGISKAQISNVKKLPRKMTNNIFIRTPPYSCKCTLLGEVLPSWNLTLLVQTIDK